METLGRHMRGRRAIIASAIIIAIIPVVVLGSWVLLQPRARGAQHEWELASDFSLTDLNGSSFRLSDFRGKVVVIDFMATWCGPCRLAMPHFRIIWEKEDFEDAIVVMSIDIDPTETAATLRSFVEDFPYATWIWARDTANLAQAYEVVYIPKTVIIDQDGYIRFTHTGVIDASVLVDEINQLLEE